MIAMEDSVSHIQTLEVNISAINSVADTVRHTVGPKGLDVMLVDQYGDFQCTNDGVAILSAIQVQHPAGKLLIEIAKAQERQIGDGTTSVVIFASEILNLALEKIKNGHPAIPLIKGISMAIDKTIELLERHSTPVQQIDDPRLRSATLISARGDKELTDLLIKLATYISEKNSFEYLITKFDFSSAIHSCSRRESEIFNSYFINKRAHYHYDNDFYDCKCLIIEGPLEPEALSSEVISTDTGVARLDESIDKLLSMADKITHLGIKAIFLSGSIMPKIEEFFIKEGIFVLSNLRQIDINALIRISGASKASRQKLLNTEASTIKALSGTLEYIQRSSSPIGVFIKGTEAQEATLLLSAELESALAEKKRIAIDAANAFKKCLESGYVLGGGVAEINLIERLRKSQDSLSFSKDIITGFNIITDALPALFKQIVKNAGYDPKAKLESINFSASNKDGIDLDTGEICNYDQLGILDPLALKVSIFRIVKELVNQVLKIKLILQAK